MFSPSTYSFSTDSACCSFSDADVLGSGGFPIVFRASMTAVADGKKDSGSASEVVALKVSKLSDEAEHHHRLESSLHP